MEPLLGDPAEAQGEAPVLPVAANAPVGDRTALTPSRATARPAVVVAASVVWAVLVAILFPLILGYGNLVLASSWLLLAGVVYSVDLINSSIRYLSLAHVGLWGIAAYSGLIMMTHGHGFWLSALTAVAICELLALVVAVVAFRTSGYYFAILTFVVSELVLLALTNNVWHLTGGTEGLVLANRPDILGFNISSPAEFLRFTCVVTLLIVLFVYFVKRSDFGRLSEATGEASNLAESLGVATYRRKVAMFTLATIPTAVSGILYGMFEIAVQPGLFGNQLALAILLIAIIGGTGTLAGPLLGALLYTAIPQILPVNPTVATGLVGVVFILVIRFCPGGLSELLSRLSGTVRRGMRERRDPARVAE